MRQDNISAIHRDIRDARMKRRGASASPESASRGLFKEYPRMPRIVLPDAPLPEITLAEALQKRSSYRGKTAAALSLQKIGALLAALKIREDGARPYPSGGAFYPIETYLVGSIEGHEKEVFHYQPKVHALEALWGIPEALAIADIFTNQIEQRGMPSAALIFTAVWERSARKYGDFAYNLSLLEAGHMAQNVLLMGAALEVGAAPIGGFRDDVVHSMLDIGSDEQAVYAIAFS